MSPTRRVLVAIGALLVAMVALTLLSWHLQVRALSQALVEDLQVMMESRIPRSSAGKHENGYACFAEVERVTPKDLSPIDQKNADAVRAVLDGGVMPEGWPPKLDALAPWAESLRDCGDAQALAFVPGVTPFEQSEQGNQLVMALARITRLQARELAARGDWELLAQRCASTLEVSLDWSHVNLIGAMIAASVVKQLAPPCGHALLELEPAARARLAPRFAASTQRLVTSRQVAERERQVFALSAYGWLLPDDQRLKLPSGYLVANLESASTRFALRRLWSRHDRAMRALVETADTPGPERREAGRALDEMFNAWWLPIELRGTPQYEKFFLRNEDTMTLLQLLAHLAASSPGALPPGISRTSEGYELTTFDGATVLVPAPAG